MKNKCWIHFNAFKVPGGAATILEPVGCGTDVAEVLDGSFMKNISVTVRLNIDDPRIPILHGVLKQYGIEARQCPYIEYEDHDLQNARLLEMDADINQRVYAGPALGTKYDLSDACPNCETGAKQTSPLYIGGENGPALIRKHRAVGTTGGHILVDGGMVKKLKDAQVTGISFGEVRQRLKNKKWSMVAREQILIEHIMPPMPAEYSEHDQKQLCKVCKRGGRMSSQPYRPEDLVGIKDFNLTWEWFGEFWLKDERHMLKRPYPFILVTPKAMNIFRDAGVTAFEWTPVNIKTST